ncbi:hypothetical protein A6R68_19703, partial [Neotoma lepida]
QRGALLFVGHPNTDTCILWQNIFGFHFGSIHSVGQNCSCSQVLQDIYSEHGHLIIIMCNKSSAFAFDCVLGYLGVMFLQSYLCFSHPGICLTYSEKPSSWLSACWCSALPHHIMVAVEVISILAFSAGILGLIFGPKCNITLSTSE